MWTDSEKQAADRLRELAHDRVASPYLVGLLLASTDPQDWPDFVQAALVYRERFGASGNGSPRPSTEALTLTWYATRSHHPRCTCDACEWLRKAPL